MRQHSFGIPDALFVRGEVPMTKEEIRVISLSKLKLQSDSILWDIGAGTGSVSIESALYCSEGKVYAIEKDHRAVGLLTINSTAFGVNNLKIIDGVAPEALKDLPRPDRVFIGGSGEYTEGILEEVVEKPYPPNIIVINSITLETACSSLKFLESRGYIVEMVCVNIATSKKVGSKTMMLAKNPVYILSAQL